MYRSKNLLGPHTRMGLPAVLLVLLGLTAGPVIAQTALNNLRVSESQELTRLVFDLSASVRHSIFTLSNPDRVVIDLEGVHADHALPDQVNNITLLERIRSAPRNDGDLRIVLDLKHRARAKSFPLKPKGPYGHRLVVDLYDGRIRKHRNTVKTVPRSDQLRDIVIAIDAGHGGKDPGAIGNTGTREKDVALGIARRLASVVDNQYGMKSVLIRDGDYYVDHQSRIDKARRYKADMFISIHADAFHKVSARGSSVYALSLSGATSEAAKWLADKENAADLIGGVSLDDKDDLVASVLLDLSQTATIQSSLEAGKFVLDKLSAINEIHKSTVQQAGFLVLMSPDIPSLLIETAFITNPTEERNLKSATHQKKIVAAIVSGLQEYYRQKSPPGTLLAQRASDFKQSERLAAFE